MTTLPEALESLDEIADCHDSGCLFAAPKRGVRTNGGCRALKDMAHTAEERQLLFRLAAVVKAAREEVAKREQERIARFDEEARASCERQGMERR